MKHDSPLREAADPRRLLAEARKARLGRDYASALALAEDGLASAETDINRELAFERAVALYWLDRPADAIAAFDLLVVGGGLPDDLEEAIEESRRYAVMALPDGAERRLANGVALLAEILPEIAIGELKLHEGAHPAELGGPQLRTRPEGGIEAVVPPGYLVTLDADLNVLTVEERLEAMPVSAPVATLDSGTLELCTEHWEHNGRERTRHRLIRRGSSGGIESISHRFRLTDSNEEATGICVENERLILGFGVDNRHAAFAICDLSTALAVLRS